ncbi:MAG: tRNA (adenosine(37)-N6)-dimethylallyltransferase MiaA [Coriobacteriia bacterium]|nr:tRNA (adenosine(37)-N6)-dimethylallyltransferase MiaA [Coriobacteriia bacterium]MBN2821847.1 tRNA (adenosine(37)-N6)-dimethylallyltransferase MiaA [Coriobacteriia bacterium]
MTGLPTVIAIVGPTAVGKSAVGDAVAHALGGEIISADSMQIYRGMDIGTAKTPAEERRVPYHCLDLMEPGTPYSAALYQRDARAAIDMIAGRHKVPVMVGGTGLYIRAALDDMRFPSGDLATPLRRHYEELAADLGAAALHELLADRDPVSANLIHPNNIRRVVRALEMADEGTSYAEQAAGFSERTTVYPTVLIGLTMERSALYARIEARIDAMLQQGLLTEIRGLLAEGYRDAMTAAQAIGYKEIIPVLEQGADLAEAVLAIKQATRRYAKRQLSWFRSDPRVVWLDVTELSPEQATARVLELLESSEPILPAESDD